MYDKLCTTKTSGAPTEPLAAPGTRVQVSVLSPTQLQPRPFQPSARTQQRLLICDMLIYYIFFLGEQLDYMKAHI